MTQGREHRSRRAAGLALALLALAPPAAAAGPAEPTRDNVQRYVRAAARLYESLDYDQALEQLARAKALGPRADEGVEISLYEGIIYADMSGHREQSQAAFRAALLLRPDARLPVKVSPKVERDFEQIRKQVSQELARSRRREKPPASSPSDRPVASASPSPALVPAAPASAAAAPPGPLLFGARVPVVPAALGGVAVAAGVGGTVFGLLTRSSLDQAQRAAFQDEAYAHWQDASRTAPVANTLFVAAGLLAGGAVATYFLLPHQ